MGAKLQAVEDFDEAAFSAYVASEDYNEETAATWNSRTLANRAAPQRLQLRRAQANLPLTNPQAVRPGGGGPGR